MGVFRVDCGGPSGSVAHRAAARGLRLAWPPFELVRRGDGVHISTGVSRVMKPNPRVLEAFGASAGEPRPPTQRADFDVNHNRSDNAGNAGIWVLFLLTQILRSAVCYHIRTRTLCPEARTETEIDSR